MPHIIGSVDDSNGQLAHYNLLQTIHDFASANGWEVLRYDTTIENRELALKGKGYSGTEEIYIFFYCYQSAANDYYNIAVGAGIGYVASNSITTQPGVIFSGVPAHNRQINYWITLNPQRIAGAMRVGTPVYESFYIGKLNASAPPNQYPLALVCAGMLDGAAAVRFSDSAHSMPYKGNINNFRLRFNDGVWKTPEVWPWNNSNITGTITHVKPTNDVYQTLEMRVMNAASGYFGELDGVYQITGFGNAVERTFEIDGITHIVIQNVARTGANDYYALKLEA